MILSTLLLACTGIPDHVAFGGEVQDAPGGEGQPAAGVTLRSFDRQLDLVDEVVTDEQGRFSVLAAAGAEVHFELQGEGFAPTGISGTAGVTDAEVDDGTFWIRQSAALQEIVDGVAGCPSGPGAGVIEGEFRFHIPGYDVGEGEEWPLATTAWIQAIGEDGEALPTCYLDAETLAWDPEAELSGDAGRFVVLGAPSGIVEVEVGYDLTDGSVGWSTSWLVYVPAEGVAPLYPAYLPMPGT